MTELEKITAYKYRDGALLFVSFFALTLWFGVVLSASADVYCHWPTTDNQHSAFCVITSGGKQQ